MSYFVIKITVTISMVKMDNIDTMINLFFLYIRKKPIIKLIIAEIIPDVGKK